MFRSFYFVLILLIASLQLEAKNISQEFNQDTISDNIRVLIDKINKYTKQSKKLSRSIKRTDKIIYKNKIKLIRMKNRSKILNENIENLISEKEEIQNEVLKLTTKKYYMSMAIQHTDKKSTKSILDKEVYTIIFHSIKKELLLLDKNSKIIDRKIENNLSKISNINSFIQKQFDISSNNKELKQKNKELVSNLKYEHKQYVNHLLKLATDNSLYRGNKTISPLKSYKITKYFGRKFKNGIDSEKILNSIYLKTKIKNSKVRAMFDGKIAFVRNNIDGFPNMIMIKHKTNFYTIYSSLTKIPKYIKIGKKILRGSKLGVINDTLVLQATKNNKYIDPKKLFR